MSHPPRAQGSLPHGRWTWEPLFAWILIGGIALVSVGFAVLQTWVGTLPAIIGIALVLIAAAASWRRRVRGRKQRSH